MCSCVITIHYISFYLISGVAGTAAEAPTLPQLISFPTQSGRSINITQEVSTHYTMLGPLLLEDKDGTFVDYITFQYQQNATRIMLEILKRWIGGEGKQPVSWSTLTETFRAIGLNKLAETILESLIFT